MVSAEMDGRFVRFAKAVKYQRRLVALCAACWHKKAVRTLPGMAFSCLVEDWSLLRLFAKRWCLAHENRLKTLLRLRYI